LLDYGFCSFIFKRIRGIRHYAVYDFTTYLLYLLTRFNEHEALMLIEYHA